VVVVLVVDMAGSTSLRQEIGEPRFGRVLRELMTAGERIVARHSGRMMKDMGDGFLAIFPSASAALAAGVGILQAVAGGNRRRAATEQVRLRVGISAGEAQWESGDVAGIVPVEATRLENAARPDSILCSDLVKVLARDGRNWSFTDAGELPLRGLREPVRAWYVEWQTTTTSRQLGLPEPLEAEPRLDFVGRGDELSRLDAGWDAVKEGRGRLVSITGEPGVGKTRLCAEFARSALGDGGIVLYGRCDQIVAYPYQPFVEALRRYANRAAHLELIPAAHAAELARLVPEIREQLPGLGEPVMADGDTQRYHLFEAVVEWLQFLAREDPVVVILDDVTWATAPTLALLHHITSRLGEMKVLALVTYRPQEATDPLLDVLAGVPRRMPFETIPLGGLGQNDVLLALRGLLGGGTLAPDVEAIGAAVWRESGGNPFYVGELFASLLDSGSIQLGTEGWTATVSPAGISVPAVLGDVVLQRKRTLAAETQRMLGAAAVAGVTFDSLVIRDVVGMEQGAFAAALDEAERSGLARCVGGPSYEFSHVLVQEVLYHDHSAAQRAELHEAIARAIEAAAGGRTEELADDLAVHYSMAAGPEAAARAASYSAIAAVRASERFAYSEAVGHYQRALAAVAGARLQDPDRVRYHLMIDLGVAQHRAGDPEAAATLLAASRLAAQEGDGMQCARAVLAGSRGLWSSTGVVDRERVQALRTALDLIGEEDSPVRARLLANLSVELGFSGDHAEPDRLSDDATAMAHRLGRPAALVPVLSLRLVTMWRPDKVRERLALSLELEQLCEDYGRPQATLLTATMGCQAAMEAGDFATADRRLATIDHITSGLRQPLALGYARLRQSLRASVAGRLDESERLADEAYEYAKASGQPDARAFWVGQIFNIRFHQGRLGEVFEELAETADEHPGIVAFRAAVAMVAAELDQLDPARRALDAVVGPEGTGVPDDLNWLISVAFVAQASARLGDAELCGRLADQLGPYRGQFVDNASTFWGSVEHYIALALSCTGRHEEADEAFRRAGSAHELLDAPILLARTRLEWADATLRAGGPAGLAAERFRAALSTAERLDLRTIARRAREGLAGLAGLEPGP
jgi:class 3 adenylate cyclase/tetratricopeptide (TPR) repeat protein